jgi:cystathionine gamma-synthase
MNTEDETILAAAAIDCDPTHGAVMPPLYLSSNYSFESYAKPRRYDYSRSGNPTRDQLADALTALERGAGCVVAATGMAAIDLALNLVEPKRLIIAPHDCYGGTWRLFNALHTKGQIEVAFVDEGDAEAMDAALTRAPALVWVETPSNPLMRVVDIAALTRQAHAAGAIVAVDNTFMSPLLQKPLTLGADIVVHSTTKYINGHSDVVGGAVVAKSREHAEKLAWWANCRGVTAAPFDCWLTLRGLRTLSVRMERQQQSAAIIAERLSTHPAISRVYYPGLTSHPTHAIAARQQSGFGAMVSADLATPQAAAQLVETLHRFTLAESLGGVESLICHPATMTHASMSADARRSAAIGEGLVRLSIGLEHIEDLWRDLEVTLDSLVTKASAA